MQTVNAHAFNISTCPLTGRHLIEASAGTGKTYTLVNLYLRLLFERQLLPAQILVVTFTEAATQELTQRLRDNIRAFKAWLQFQTEPDNQGLVSVYKGIQRQVLSLYGPQGLLPHIGAIERSFDDAPISTIHSFCQRALQHYALHSGQAFQYRLDNDTGPQILQCVADVWRQRFYGDAADTALLPLLLAKKISPESLVKDLSKAFENTSLRCIPAPEASDFRRTDAALKAALDPLWQTWQQEASSIMDCVTRAIEKKHLNGVTYKRATVATAMETLQQVLTADQELDSCFQQLMALGAEPKALKLFGADLLNAKTNRNKPRVTEEHDFFEQAQAVLEALEATHTARENAIFDFYQGLLSEVRQSLKVAKSRAQVLDFQDLLMQLAEALGPGDICGTGDLLAQLLHAELPVALIDEFQDTDHWQYQIFDRIYATGDLFLIGDPKQSIYRFRGADLQVYLKAREAVPEAQRWTLDTNFRSSPEYISALNHFFTHERVNPLPFGTPDIAYYAVKAGKASKAAAQQPALCLWYAEPPEDKKQHEKYDFDRWLLQVVAEGVWQELDAGTPAESIAILVGKHRQAEALAEILQKRQIPCLVHGQQNVFRSKEAQDMVLFLEAVLAPREALTPVFTAYALGYTAAEIEALQNDETRWIDYLERCQELRQQWQKYGFFTMWSRFVKHFEVYTRSLLFAHGERAITNFRQLSHLLQDTAQAQDLSPEHTLLWLQRQIQSPSAHQEEQLLHLESERKAVQILTMHRSKGLEYPVVFCPYLWLDSAARLTLPYTVALPDGETVLEMGSADEETHKTEAKAQILQEQLRLSYVALTRAAQRCHVYWGIVARQKQSPLKHYFQSEDTALPTLQALAEHPHIQVAPFPGVTGKPWREADTAEDSPPTLAFKPQSAPNLSEDFQITSFTRLSAQAEDGGAEAVVTASGEPQSEQLKKQPLLVFPRGAESGIFLHGVLETLNFTQAIDTQTPKVKQHMALYGIENHWLSALGTALEAILHTPFTAPLSSSQAASESQPPPETGLCLAQLDPALCLKEWDFDLYLPHFDPQHLQTVYAAHGIQIQPESLGRAQRSYLTGSIDLLFCHEGRYFIADYKSNDLGTDFGDYHPEALTAAMQHHQYFLQLTLYTLALHLYLQKLLPNYAYDTHIGGSYYFFLRGMHPDLPGNGVYFYRPDAALIQDLAQHWSIS